MIEIGDSPPSGHNKKKHHNEIELIKAASENRGSWVSMELNNEGMALSNPNRYGRLYRGAAVELGVQISIKGGKTYLLIP